jgi:hypothetical protein
MTHRAGSLSPGEDAPTLDGMHGATSVGVHDTEPIRIHRATPDEASGDATDQVRPRRPARLGVAGAVTLIAALGGLAVIAVPPFGSADEHAHAGYGLTIFLEGRLPTLFDHVQQILPLQQAKPQHVANHPPLFYLLTGPLLALGVTSGHLITGYLLARSVSVLAAMVTVGLVASFAHTVFRGRRPEVTIGAAALTATYAPFVSISGVLHNDALAVAFSTAVLALTVLVLRRGPEWPLVAALAATALGGTAVRANNASLLLVACLAVLTAALVHAGPGERRRGVVRGLSAALVLGATSVVGIGWFFLRNQMLYGSALGYGVLGDVFGRPARPQSLWMFRHPELLLTQLNLPPVGDMLSPEGLLTVLPVLACLVGAVLLLRRSRGPRTQSEARPVGGPPSESTIRRALIGLFLLHATITFVMVVRHVDGGGGIHVRYLFPLLPIAATVAAAALLRLPGGRRGGYLVLAVAAGVVTSVERIGLSTWRWESRQATGPALEGIRKGLEHWGLPGVAILVAVLVVVAAAVGAVAAGVWRSSRSA